MVCLAPQTSRKLTVITGCRWASSLGVWAHRRSLGVAKELLLAVKAADVREMLTRLIR
jgi:hypothetical protein